MMEVIDYVDGKPIKGIKADLSGYFKDDDEIKRILRFSEEGDCIRYIVAKHNDLSYFDGLLLVLNSVLTVLPVVLFSSLPLFAM